MISWEKSILFDQWRRVWNKSHEITCYRATQDGMGVIITQCTRVQPTYVVDGALVAPVLAAGSETTCSTDYVYERDFENETILRTRGPFSPNRRCESDVDRSGIRGPRYNNIPNQNYNRTRENVYRLIIHARQDRPRIWCPRKHDVSGKEDK